MSDLALALLIVTAAVLIDRRLNTRLDRIERSTTDRAERQQARLWKARTLAAEQESPERRRAKIRRGDYLPDSVALVGCGALSVAAISVAAAVLWPGPSDRSHSATPPPEQEPVVAGPRALAEPWEWPDPSPPPQRYAKHVAPEDVGEEAVAEPDGSRREPQPASRARDVTPSLPDEPAMGAPASDPAVADVHVGVDPPVLEIPAAELGVPLPELPTEPDIEPPEASCPADVESRAVGAQPEVCLYERGSNTPDIPVVPGAHPTDWRNP